MLPWLTGSSGTSPGSFTNPFEVTSFKDFQNEKKLLILTKGGYLFVVNQIELLLKEDHFESELKSYISTLIHTKNDSAFGLFLQRKQAEADSSVYKSKTGELNVIALNKMMTWTE